jgi:hypothetical protein
VTPATATVLRRRDAEAGLHLGRVRQRAGNPADAGTVDSGPISIYAEYLL